VFAERHLRVFEQVFVVLAMHAREGEGGRRRGEVQNMPAWDVY
jgi:hypothetical protein